MTQVQPNALIYPQTIGTPLYSYANNVTPNTQTVCVAQPNNVQQVYQYPQTSVYSDPNKQAASGVNIYIYNPSGVGAPNSNSTANATYNMVPQAPMASLPVVSPNSDVKGLAPVAQTPIANTPINQDSNDKPVEKTKRIVELTDEYIKTLENWLHSPDERIRNSAIKEILLRFEEDESRYNDPALTALLNISLQDPSASNRLLAMSTIAGGSAQGDENTLALLEKLTKSEKMYGQEAMMANNALLKAIPKTKIVPDNSTAKKSDKK